MVKTTRLQREALFKVFQRDFPNWITVTTRHDGTYCKRSSKEIVKVPSFQWNRRAVLWKE
jgi:hypothetical protein